MKTHRVVVTGACGISALGDDWPSTAGGLREMRNRIVRMDSWDEYSDLNTRLGCPIPDFKPPAHFTRKKMRSMGRVSKLATFVTERALDQAGLRDAPLLTDGSTGVSYGSSTGSTDATADFVTMLVEKSMGRLNATTYVRMMSHTAAVNLGVYFSTKGRLIPTSSACTAGSQGIGYAYEAIKYGQQRLMLAGGGEELCPTEAAVFDVLYATSTRNDEPQLSPRPFDTERDGLVIGEGACTLVLEDFDSARARGAHILAEIVGFGTNTDGQHVTRPNSETMGRAIELALADAGLDGAAIGYVCAHGTATEHGDIAESQATRRVLGHPAPISSLKSYTGHTLGACGALEAWCSIQMMNENWYAPTVNLDQVDGRCGELDYIRGELREMQNEYVMSNNFAFGGINTSLIFRRVD